MHIARNYVDISNCYMYKNIMTQLIKFLSKKIIVW